MGDGEISGNGVEVSGSVVVRTSIKKNITIDSPVIETSDEVIFINTEKSFEKASKACVLRATRYIYNILELDNFNDAYRIVSATCDLAISQAVNGVITTKLKVPRYLLGWKGFI